MSRGPLRTGPLTVVDTLVNEDHVCHLQGEFIWLLGSKWPNDLHLGQCWWGKGTYWAFRSRGKTKRTNWQCTFTQSFCAVQGGHWQIQVRLLSRSRKYFPVTILAKSFRILAQNQLREAFYVRFPSKTALIRSHQSCHSMEQKTAIVFWGNWGKTE